MTGGSHRGAAPLIDAGPGKGARLHELVEGAGAIIWQCDASWRYTFVSASAEKVLGYPPSAWSEDPDFWVNHLHPNDRERAIQKRKDAIAQHQDFEQELRMIAADGSAVWLRSVVSVGPGADPELHGVMLDITDRKRAEQALSATEERLRRAQGAAKIGTFDWHIASDELTWNGVEEIHGVPEGSFGGTFDAYLRDIHPDDAERVVSSIREAVSSGANLSLEYRIVWPDGTVRWVEGAARAVKDDHDRVVRLAGTCMDVTARRDAQDAVRFQANLLGAIGEAAIATDVAGKILHWNHVAESLFGWTAEEAIGRLMVDLLAPEALEGDLESFIAAVMRGERAVGEFNCTARSGERVLFEATDTAIRDESGTVVGMICIGKDIAKRKAAQRALEASEQQHRVLANAFPAMATLLRPDGTHVYCNTQWYAYTGIAEDDSAGAWARILHPDQRDEVLAGWGESLTRGEAREGEALLRRHDGEYRWHLGRAVPLLGEQGELTGMLISAIDIHDRKSAERQVSELNAVLERRIAELTTILDVAPAGVCIAEDPDCRVIRVNAGAARFLGVETGANIGAPFEKPRYQLFKDGRALQASEMPVERAAMKGENIVGEELEIVHSDGSKVNALVFAAPLRDSGGSVIGSVAMFVDITSRVAGERRVEELNAQLQRRITELTTVLDLAPVGIGIADDAECRVIRANPAFATMLGVEPYTNSSLSAPEVTLPFKVMRQGVVVPPDELPMQRAAFRGETIDGIELDVLRADGTTVHLLEYASPMRDPDGRIIGSVGAFVDISERTNAERSMRFLARATDVLNSSLDYEDTLRQLARIVVPELADWCGVDVVDEQGEIRRLMLANGNPRVERRINEMGRDFPIDPSGVSMRAKAIRSGVARFYPEVTDVAIDEETENPRQADLLKLAGIVSAGCVPLVARDRVLGAISFLTAESHRKLTDSDFVLMRDLASRAAVAMDNARLFREAQQRADDLRSANEAKDEFLGLVSHELRTPITTIFGNAQVLRRREHELDDDSRRTAIGDIEQEADRLHRIVENMLTLARVETGREFATEPVLVLRVAKRLADAHMLRFPSRSVTVESPDELAAVLAEPTYLEQVIRNLLSNAEKYSPPETPIDIRIAHNDGYVSVGVLDRGAGIDPDEAEELFAAFYRSRRTSGQVSGVGMGLAVCKRLVEAQSGSVWARPREGGGSEIGFALPVAREVN